MFQLDHPLIIAFQILLNGIPFFKAPFKTHCIHTGGRDYLSCQYSLIRSKNIEIFNLLTGLSVYQQVYHHKYCIGGKSHFFSHYIHSLFTTFSGLVGTAYATFMITTSI